MKKNTLAYIVLTGLTICSIKLEAAAANIELCVRMSFAVYNDGAPEREQLAFLSKERAPTIVDCLEGRFMVVSSGEGRGEIPSHTVAIRGSTLPEILGNASIADPLSAFGSKLSDAFGSVRPTSDSISGGFAKLLEDPRSLAHSATLAAGAVKAINLEEIRARNAATADIACLGPKIGPRFFVDSTSPVQCVAQYAADYGSMVDSPVLQGIITGPGTITATGHSKGGAIAQYFAADVYPDRPDLNISVVTFGAPPAFNAEGTRIFATKIPDDRHWRYICSKDPIPGLGEQAGTPVELPAVRGTGEWAGMGSALGAALGPIASIGNAFDDHRMVRYLDAVLARLAFDTVD